MNREQQIDTFRRWLSRHRGLLLKIVRSFAFSAHDQDDLFQEVTLCIWDSIPRRRQAIAESTWIYRVSLYAAINWSKKEKRVLEKGRSLEEVEHLLVRPEERADPRLDWLYEQIAKFDEVDRSLTLLMLEGLSYREMSETLGISVSNVGVKINRLKKRLNGLSVMEKTS